MSSNSFFTQLVPVGLLLISSIISLAAAQIAKPNCPHHCGSVSIPYPFGLSHTCSLNQDFLITCNYSSEPPQPYLWDPSLKVSHITLDGYLRIQSFVAQECYDRRSRDLSVRSYAWLVLEKFTISQSRNKFTVVGCDSFGFLEGLKENKTYTSGCMSMCKKLSDVEYGSCSGNGCCQIEIPEGLYNINVTAFSFNNHTNVSDFNPCTSAFIVENGMFNFSAEHLNMAEDAVFSLMLDWSVENGTSREVCKDHATSYGQSQGFRCRCVKGYEGNPYLGCHDVDECKDRNLHKCSHACNNTDGDYKCSCPKGHHGDGRIDGDRCYRLQSSSLITIFLCVAIGLIVLLVACSWLYFVVKRRKFIKLKEKFFQENGGLLLQQELSKREGTSDTTKIFTAEELKKATNNYDSSRIVGKGGYGVVYRGILANGREVAIKKSTKVDQMQIEPFINEVIILSQVNHRNVVKLLGCCLETKVPLLVYEFIAKGTVFEHLHKETNGSIRNTLGLRWGIRLRIAAETAGAISYLHSAASIPIIHRDIKTTNILLDANYTAKVSDFGASRLVPDETKMVTLVQGTWGYLDPEYLRSSQLTEKSDVYSFGVVLAEILTSKKPLCSDRSENDRSLAAYFVSSLKQGRLFEIIDDRIISDGNKEQLEAVAKLAKCCLELKGEERPTMKEVATELEGLRMEKKHMGVEVISDEVKYLHNEQSSGFCHEDVGMSSIGFDTMKEEDILSISDGR